MLEGIGKKVKELDHIALERENARGEPAVRPGQMMF
jgi:hypothetical protein